MLNFLSKFRHFLSRSRISLTKIFFKNPWKFQPERHLNENGDFQKSVYQQPFNTGKRSCPGQILADIELFHFTKNLMKYEKLI